MKNNRTTRQIDRKAASLPTIRRLPGYLQVVRQAEQDGVLVISGTTIAEELELEPIQVRKDLACERRHRRCLLRLRAHR